MTAKPSSHRALIFAACLGALAALGWIDYVTGYELGFFIFYSVPVGIAAWQLGLWPAIVVSLAASATWWLADSYSGAKYSSAFYFYWNNGIHFGSFVINAITISKVKRELDRRHQLAAELDAARNALRAVAPLITACPCCGRSRSGGDGGGDATVLCKTQEQSVRADLAAALCEACRGVESQRG